MMKRTLLCVAIVSAILLPLMAHSQKVTVDWDHNVHTFTAFKTYRWIEPARPSPNPLMDQRIAAAIEGQLSAKGLQKVDGPADLLVTYRPGVRQERSATAIGLGAGRYRMGGGMATINQNVSNVGTLLVDISDAKTKQLIWRATAADTLSDKPDKNSKKIEKAVAKMFKQYPPPVK